MRDLAQLSPVLGLLVGLALPDGSPLVLLCALGAAVLLRDVSLATRGERGW